MPWGSGTWGGRAWGQSQTGPASYARTITNSWSVSDSMAKGVHIQDTVAISDSMARTVGRPRTITNTLASISDNMSTGSTAANTSDTVAVSDSMSATRHYTGAISDAVAVSDSIARTLGQARGMSDTVLISDLVGRHYSATTSDTVSVTDSMAKGVSVIHTIALSQTVAMSIDASRPISHTEIRVNDDMNSSYMAFNRSVSDTWPVTDSVASSARSSGRTVSHTVPLSETMSRVASSSQTIRNTVSIYNYAVRGNVRHRDISDTWTVGDTITTLSMTPKMRQQWRIAMQREHPTPDDTMGNGSLFTFQAGAANHGSFAYGRGHWTQDLHEAYLDGGILTWDVTMASPARDTGLFVETPQ